MPSVYPGTYRGFKYNNEEEFVRATKQVPTLDYLLDIKPMMCNGVLCHTTKELIAATLKNNAEE